MNRCKLYTLSLFMSFSCLSSACSKGDNENGKLEPPSGGESTLLMSTSLNAVKLKQQNEDDDAVTFTWTAGTNAGKNRPVNYFFELDIADNNFVTSIPAKKMPSGTYSIKYSVKELNKLVIDYWKKHLDEPVKLEARITAKVESGSYVKPETSSVKISVEPYTPEYSHNPYKAPLYWSPYEYNYVHNSYIPEEEWKKNIDWVALNLAPYGYKMVSTDGWMDENACYNEYGYLTRHSCKWEHDYAYWAKYLESKGMTLGVYSNPLWIPQAAAESGVIIKGTNIPLSSIMNLNEHTVSYRWVQIDRPGAEEYVKGYIEHYASMGVKYLRVDFLSFFENGQDRGLGKVGVDRPHWIYETALRWMREECNKQGIFLSLVMPHLFNDGEAEVKYGHMVRIGEDTGNGGWWKFSVNNRGIHQYGWSQYSNPFDGFIYFSRISGRNRMILDGDFIRLNTFENDDEKRTCISLNLIAGGPVTVSDLYNTIGSDLWLYQNRELLELNADGFVGKPFSPEPSNDKSQIWYGQMSNGDWIIGLFNREITNKEYNIKFLDLGISGSWKIRDIWEHSNLERSNSFQTNLRPHACKIIRLSK